MVSLRESKGASSLGDSSGCVTVKALDSSSRELGRALWVHFTLMPHTTSVLSMKGFSCLPGAEVVQGLYLQTSLNRLFCRPEWFICRPEWLAC